MQFSEVTESFTISNVSPVLVQKFADTFPDQPQLYDYVRRGYTDNVDHILTILGNWDEESGKYLTLNDAQRKVVGEWWDLYSVCFYD